MAGPAAQTAAAKTRGSSYKLPTGTPMAALVIVLACFVLLVVLSRLFKGVRVSAAASASAG